MMNPIYDDIRRLAQVIPLEELYLNADVQQVLADYLLHCHQTRNAAREHTEILDRFKRLAANRPTQPEQSPTAGEMSGLVDCWSGIVRRVSNLGTPPSASVTNKWWKRLVDAYTEPHRRYHNLVHIINVIRAVDTLIGSWTTPAISPADRDLILIAAWFHDVVYDPKRNNNEAESAEVARQFLVDIPRHDLIDTIVSLVMATRYPSAMPANNLAPILRDADLSPLAFPRTAFMADARDIRQEYAHLSDEEWLKGRLAFGQMLLDQPQIYATEFGRQQWEPIARANLGEMVHTLSGGSK